MRALLWLRNDLRVQDHPALNAALAEADELLCVFCVDARWFRVNQYGARSMGRVREGFLHESLRDLRADLDAEGLRLLVLRGDPVQQMVRLCGEASIHRVYQSRPLGTYERTDVRRVREALPEVAFIEYDTATLFSRRQVQPLLTEFPATFSRFRRQAESWPVESPVALTDGRPAPLKTGSSAAPVPWCGRAEGCEFAGGAEAAWMHLQAYFAGSAASTYKETRNALDDVNASTRFSPWLASGCISPRQVLAALRTYEAAHGANDSTYWIHFELLWREYFHWYEQFYGRRLFAFSGITRRRPLTTFYPQRFRAWCEGRTPWPLVNACMRRLNQTGYLSNRGRQIAASCLVNELQLDWRCGAAWFEQQLVDYDVASNWGNWQYIAGVGADARGGRHFNLEKQAQLFDPAGEFVGRWGGDANVAPLDSVDAADWPISPTGDASADGSDRSDP